MKLSASFPYRIRQNRRAGFTLPEALIATSVFLLLVIGIISANLFGLRWYQIGQNEMVATDSAREAISKMSGELRNCNNALVGIVTNGAFVAHVTGEQQAGNGLMIYATTNTNSYVLYYVNTSNENFIRFSSDVGSNYTIAEYVTNQSIFQCQNYSGQVLTNLQNNFVIHCSLQYYYAPPQTPGSTLYQIQTSVAPRSQN